MTIKLLRRSALLLMAIFLTNTSHACMTKLQQVIEKQGRDQDQGQGKILRLIKKSDVNEKACDGRTALMIAASYGELDIVDMLIKHKAEVNAKDFKGNTPLHWSIFANDEKTMKFLLDNKANINAQNDQGETVIMELYYYNRIRIGQNIDPRIMLLLNRGIDLNLKDIFNDTLIMKTTMDANLFIKYGANVNIEDGYRAPLLIHSAYGHTSSVKDLLDAGAYINFISRSGSTALIDATKHGRYENVRYLVIQGADLNVLDTSQNSALHYSTQWRDGSLTSVISNLKLGINIRNMKGETPLMNAVCHNGELGLGNYINLGAVHFLLMAGADVNARDSQGRTVLGRLPRCQDENLDGQKTYDLLIEHGAVE